MDKRYTLKNSRYSEIKKWLATARPTHIRYILGSDNATSSLWPLSCEYDMCLASPKFALVLHASVKLSQRKAIFLCEKHVPAPIKETHMYKLAAFAARAKANIEQI